MGLIQYRLFRSTKCLWMYLGLYLNLYFRAYLCVWKQSQATQSVKQHSELSRNMNHVNCDDIKPQIFLLSVLIALVPSRTWKYFLVQQLRNKATFDSGKKSIQLKSIPLYFCFQTLSVSLAFEINTNTHENYSPSQGCESNTLQPINTCPLTSKWCLISEAGTVTLDNLLISFLD